MELLNQYFSEEEFIQNIDVDKLNHFKTISTDSYSDLKMLQSLKSTGFFDELMCSAVQMSVIGFGNKTYGNMLFKGESVSLDQLFRSCDVKTDLTLNTPIGPDVLTPRRLQRFFRYATKIYLDKNKEKSSYLYRKYSNGNLRFRTKVFPGAESMITKKDDAIYLLQVYQNLDTRLRTKITERIARVFVARSILSPEEAIKHVRNVENILERTQHSI